MAIHRFLDITLAAPDPGAVAELWEGLGLERTGDPAGGAGTLGTPERPRQLTFVEGAYRHLAELHLGCEAEADLARLAARLDALGVAAEVAGTTLTCDDPVFDHRVVVDVVEAAVAGSAPGGPEAGPVRAANRPGRARRLTQRADAAEEAVVGEAPRPPRRVGHVVLGTPHVAEARAFYVDGLGFRVSDSVLDGALTFTRVEADHHNLLVQPAPVSHLNHYALEVDDVDAVGTLGQAVLEARPDARVLGVGRHLLGSNLFWYGLDPAGAMFELFADMDQIADDEAWDRDHRRDDWSPDEVPVDLWGSGAVPEAFFEPPDLATIAACREALGRR